ncbi:alpha/beta fold hydrolase [Thalassotalea litorea]|uniref:alpha/beta fold hydrolase n=1 Tax=Thalassotalea litorea TaxID=2020715 RepID=UPI0037368221
MSKTIGTILLILGLASGAAQAMQHTYSWSQEQQLSKNINGSIGALFSKGQQSVLSRDNAPDLRYFSYIDKPQHPCIVVSPGRGEGYLKYQELVFDLVNNGFNVAIVDHRGQGLSDREQDQRHRGYVQSFDHYVEDLHHVMQSDIAVRCQGPLFLLGHSMGGTIASLYVQKYPKQFQALALSAPMFGIGTGSLPHWLATSLVSLGSGVNNLLSNKAWYFFGHGPYKEKPFVDNDLMHSEVRYNIFRKTWEQNPNVQLGGVTFSWLNAAIAGMDKAFEQIPQHQTATLLLQAEEDTVVENQAQDLFCEQLQSASNIACVQQKPLVIEGARHEILFESDPMRQGALTLILDFFNAQLENNPVPQDPDE